VIGEAVGEAWLSGRTSTIATCTRNLIFSGQYQILKVTKPFYRKRLA
jgi:hypothetical protein